MKPIAPLDFLNPTDRQLLISIKRRGEAFVDNLAEDAGVSQSTVRQRLQAFGAEGLVRRRSHVHGAGRPSIAFSLTPRAQDLFPSAAREALAHLLSSGGDTALIALPKLDVVAAVVRDAAPQSASEAATATADALGEAGYVTEVLPLDGAAALLSVVSCPFVLLAQHNAAICEAEHASLSAATGFKLRRVAHILDGSPACDFIVSRPDGRPACGAAASNTGGAG